MTIKDRVGEGGDHLHVRRCGVFVCSYLAVLCMQTIRHVGLYLRQSHPANLSIYRCCGRGVKVRSPDTCRVTDRNNLLKTSRELLSKSSLMTFSHNHLFFMSTTGRRSI